MAAQRQDSELASSLKKQRNTNKIICPDSAFFFFCHKIPVLKGTLIQLDLSVHAKDELLHLLYVPVLLHQPCSETPAWLEARRRGGEVGREGRRFSGEETQEEERSDGGAGESPELSRAAQ